MQTGPAILPGRLDIRVFRPDADHLAPAASPLEIDVAFALGEDRVVAPHPHINAGVELRSTLADDDRTWDHVLATVALDAAHLRPALASVPGRTGAFLMCHVCILAKT